MNDSEQKTSIPAKRSEVYILRSIIAVMILSFCFRIEYWPLTFYPVYTGVMRRDRVVNAYRFAFYYKDGRVSYPHDANSARRVDILMDFESRVTPDKRVGHLNIRAAFSYLHERNQHSLYEFSKLLDQLEKAVIVREKIILSPQDGVVVLEQEIVAEMSVDEMYAEIF